MQPAGLTPAQQEIRKTGLGASEVAAVAGLDPYRSALDVFSEKLGYAPPFEGNRATRLGSRLQPVIAEEALVELGGGTLSEPGTLRHPEEPWRLATPDYLLNGDTILEIKHTGYRSADAWGQGEDEIPARVLAQVTWQMDVAGIHKGAVAALIGGSDLRVYPVAYDPELAQSLVSVCRTFWFENVMAGVPPEIDGSDSARLYLAQRFPRETRPIADATAEQEQLVAQLKQAKDEATLAEARVTLYENRLKAAIGDCAGIAGNGWSITWKATKDSARTDWEALAKSLSPPPEAVQKFTQTKPGARRFLARWKE